VTNRPSAHLSYLSFVGLFDQGMPAGQATLSHAEKMEQSSFL